MDYQMIGQKLAMIKVKKNIFRQQFLVNEQVCQQQPAKLQELTTQIDKLLENIQPGEWAHEADRVFMTEQKDKLLNSKRKIEEHQASNVRMQQLQTRMIALEDEMQEKVNRCVDDERQKLKDERQTFNNYKAEQNTTIDRMIQELARYCAELRQVAAQLAVESLKERTRSGHHLRWIIQQVPVSLLRTMTQTWNRKL